MTDAIDVNRIMEAKELYISSNITMLQLSEATDIPESILVAHASTGNWLESRKQMVALKEQEAVARIREIINEKQEGAMLRLLKAASSLDDKILDKLAGDGELSNKDIRDLASALKSSASISKDLLKIGGDTVPRQVNIYSVNPRSVPARVESEGVKPPIDITPSVVQQDSHRTEPADSPLQEAESPASPETPTVEKTGVAGPEEPQSSVPRPQADDSRCVQPE